jgi:dihydroorotase
MKKILIKNGLVIDPGQRIENIRDILVENGKIKAVSKNIKISAKTDIENYNARGKWVIPGAIDIHVHTREPGLPDSARHLAHRQAGNKESETIRTASMSAASGGITSILAMPNTIPPVDSGEIIKRLKKISEKESLINVFFSGTITKNRSGFEISDIEGLVRAGAVAITDDGNSVMNSEILRQALIISKKFRIPVLEHCEDVNISDKGVVNDGNFLKSLALKHHGVNNAKRLKGIPRESEVLIAARDVILSAFTGVPIHVQHVSCAETVNILKMAKKMKLPVTAETCPHYFSLTENDILYPDANFKMKPPLRTKRDVEEIKKGLNDGTIDAIASDHAPHSPEKKLSGFEKAPFGIIGLETLIPLTLTKLVHKKIINKTRMVQLLSLNPAKILKIKTKGSLKPGHDADITIINPEKNFVVHDFYSKSKNSPFIGMKLKGQAVATIVDGRFVFKDGIFL